MGIRNTSDLSTGAIVAGSLFNEPMRIETVRVIGPDTVTLGLVGTISHVFRPVTLNQSQLSSLELISRTVSFDGDGPLLRLGIQAKSLGIAWEFDPYFGLSISRVDPLPHQLAAVYDNLLKLARVRFLLADDAGAGKTIMAGLLIKELKLRGLAERILIVCPANLAFQWQRELREKFDERFLVLKGFDIREQFGVNQWLEQKQVISSLDLAKRTDILPGLQQVHWDLVIIDEAHRMSWSPPSRKTARYALGELLRDTTDHLLLLTATPHKGDVNNFTLFLQLLDADAYADVKSIRQAMTQRRAPFYIRRTKEAMVYFPERQGDGTWVAKKIFKKRIPHTVDFLIDGPEFDLYREATRYVKQQSAKAAADEENPRARAVGFLMSLYQRRLASSTYALRHSLENRIRRLEEGLKYAQDLVKFAPPSIPDPDELEEMEESERQRLEQILDAITLAGNADQVQDEVESLKALAAKAQEVEDSGCEAKLSQLKALLQKEGFFDKTDQRLLIFTEFKDTLDYLVGKLREWGFRVGFIHGGMKAGTREDPGTRIFTEQQFKDGDIQVLVATEAAGEGINLQCCHILFNYDIPWNPNRLEQRMGRIHRYGQKKDCLIFNFVITNTIEGKILLRLLEKLQEIRNALDDDAVFNVVGEVLPAAHVERTLRDYYAGKLGDADLEDRLLRNVDEAQFRSICQNALEGLASKSINLEMLVERRARAQERRVVPETIARFMSEAATQVSLQLKSVTGIEHTFDPGRTPIGLKKYEQDANWKLPALASKYPRCSTDRETAELNNYEWVTPGHPLFESLRRSAVEKSLQVFGNGASYYSLQHEQPARLDIYCAKAVDGTGQVIHERLFAVELFDGQEPLVKEPSFLGDLLPAPPPTSLPNIATCAERSEWLYAACFEPFLEEVRHDRADEIERISQHIELSLTELLQRADLEIGRAAAEIERGVQGAEGRMAQAESRHAELLARRERRRQELQRQRSLSLQGIERLTTVLILPHPDRETPELSNLKCNRETEATAMRVAMDYELSHGRQVYDVHEKNLGYDLTSLDLQSGELRLIEVKGIGAASGMIMLTPNERRVAEDRRDCYWLYAVSSCASDPILRPPVKDPARFEWNVVSKVAHYYLPLDSLRDE